MVNLNSDSFKLRVMGILSIVPYKSQIVLLYDNNIINFFNFTSPIFARDEDFH